MQEILAKKDYLKWFMALIFPVTKFPLHLW